MIKVFNIVLCLFPILDSYNTIMIGISVGEFLIFSLGIVLLIKNSKKIFVLKRILLFYTICFTLTFIRFIFDYNSFNNNYREIISYTMYFFILLISSNFFKYEYFKKSYLFFANFICIFSIFQYIFLKFFKIKFIGLIPYYSYATGNTYNHYISVLNRITGVFLEPAHLVQYISIALIMVLFCDKFDLKKVILYSLTMILTNTGNSIILLSTILILKFFLSNNKNINIKLLKSIFIFILLTIIFSFIYKTDYFKNIIHRIDEITGKSSISASGYLRIKYGFDIYLSLSLLNKIFGIGVGNFYIYAGSVYNSKAILIGSVHEYLLNYRNGIQQILIDNGLVSLIFYIYILFKNKTRVQKYIALFLIILQLISSNFNNAYWVLFLLIIHFFSYSSETM